MFQTGQSPCAHKTLVYDLGPIEDFFFLHGYLNQNYCEYSTDWRPSGGRLGL